MYYEHIRYAAGCNSCRNANTFRLILMRENESEPLSRSKLLEEVEPESIICPACRRQGNMVILFFIVGLFYWDMEYLPQKGYIQLEIEKRDNVILRGEIVPSVGGYGSYDCLNALNLINDKLADYHNDWLDDENHDVNRYQSLRNGEYTCRVNFFEEPPYVSVKNVSIPKGFSYEEIRDVINSLIKKIKETLTEENRLY